MQTGRVVVVTVITAALTSAATFYGLRALTGGGAAAAREAEVPPLTGLRAEQARQLLDPRGLLLSITESREDPRAPAGQITQQSPLEGSRVKPGSEVRVILSTGQGTLEVPALARLPLASALQLLGGVGLRAGPIERRTDPAVPAEQVLSSSPAAGERVPRGSAVSLVVSSGGAQVKVPAVVGKTPDAAGKLLGAAGLKTGRVTYGHDEDRRAGVVIRQTPAADALVAPGSVVNLVVNEND